MSGKKLVVSLVATVATAAGVVTVATLAVAGSANAATAVKWRPCKEMPVLECATIKVPMDYARPKGKQISLAISRLLATDAGKRRGVLFTNPGGPGGEGSFMPLAYAEEPIARVYDIYGIDARGLGGSTQLECDLTRVPEAPETSRPADKDFPKIAAQARALAAGCARAGGEFRRHVNTANTARDMNRLRAVLGEKKINYLGVSYGTWLGAVYGQMFPQHLDRSVLDSSLDPDKTWREQAFDVVDTIAANVRAWSRWTARRDATFGLGHTRREVRMNVERIAAALRKGPVAGFKNISEFDTLVGSSVRYRQLWASLAKNLRKTLDEIDGRPADPRLARSNHRAAAAAEQMDEKTMNGVYFAVLCEWDWPTKLEVYYRDMRRVRDTMPYDNSVSQLAPHPCAFNDVAVEAPPAIGRARYPRGLVLASEGDTQTPLVNGQVMARTLGSSLVAVRDEGQHGQYAAGDPDPQNPVNANKCVDDIVNAYLVDGIQPPRRVHCDSANPPADVPTDGGPLGLPIPDLGELAEGILDNIRP